MDVKESIKKAIRDYPYKEHLHENPSCEFIDYMVYTTGLNLNELELHMQKILSDYYKGHYKEYLQTPHWKRFREKALRRYGNCCCLCNSTDLLEVHHKTYDSIGSESFDDVIVLCALCHGIHHYKVIY